ncbi:hypothetical protein Bbelb_014640 [Branchiostoma belcheri]|nr:hypothetical protein Bbelb_014640 [Branchiostoma belcheri]
MGITTETYEYPPLGVPGATVSANEAVGILAWNPAMCPSEEIITSNPPASERKLAASSGGYRGEHVVGVPPADPEMSDSPQTCTGCIHCNLVSEPKTNRPKQGQKSRPSPPSPHLRIWCWRVEPIPLLPPPFTSPTDVRKHPAINGHIAYKPPLCFMYELCPPGRPACRFAPSHGFHDHGPPPPLLIGPAIPKRPRLGPPLAVAMRRSQSRMIRHTNMSNDGDILICGRCKRLFSNIHRLQHHKLVGCRPHVTCGCRKKDLKVDDFAGDQPPASLSCAECGQPCSSPWELLQHASLQHDNTIYLQDPDREGEGGQITLGDAEGSEGKASLEMESDVTSSVSGESMDEQMNGFVTDLKLETGR